MHVRNDSGSDQKLSEQAEEKRGTPGSAQGGPPEAQFGWKAIIGDMVGSTIDNKYDLIRLLGTGGMGSVFQARQRLNNRVVALKMLLPHLANEGVSLRRFQLEAKAAARIDHPNSIVVYDYGVWEDQAYLAMEYVEGSSLSDVIRQRGKLSLEEGIPLFIQASAGLHAAHRLGIFHRDVKPSNFMVVPTDTNGLVIKVCDFGLAKLKVTEGETITSTGEVFGSPPYMSPEQCLGKRIDERSDIYGFGCLMFESLTGVVPLKGASPLDTMRRQVSTPPPPLNLSDVATPIASKMDRIIERALAKEPNDRFSSMHQLGQTLEALKEDMEGRALYPKDSWVKRVMPAWDTFGRKRQS